MLRNFTRLPTKWIHDRRLVTLGLTEVWALKVIFGLAIIWGHSERRRAESLLWFPASLADLSDASHLSRNDALQGVRQLLDAGLIDQRKDKGREVGVHPRTSVFRFAGAEAPYFPFPHFHIEKSEVLGMMRRGQASLAALKIYLMLGAFRDRRSGHSQLSYDKMEEYGGVRRAFIRRGLSLLYESGLVHVTPPAEGRMSSRYLILGISRDQPARTDEALS